MWLLIRLDVVEQEAATTGVARDPDVATDTVRCSGVGSSNYRSSQRPL
jgi:hypothetical protein